MTELDIINDFVKSILRKFYVIYTILCKKINNNNIVLSDKKMLKGTSFINYN